MTIANIKPRMGRLAWDCELGEDLNAGDPVMVYDDLGSKVKKVLSQEGNSVDFGRGYYNAMAKIGVDKYVIVYKDIGASSHGYARVFQFDAGGNITMGTPVRFYAASVYYIDVCPVDTDKIVIVYKGGSNFGYAVVGEISGLTITLGSPVAFNSAYAYYNSCCQLDTNKFVVCFKDAGTSSYGVARIGEISGIVITFGTAITFSPGVTSYISCCSMGSSDKFAVSYYVSSSGRARVATVAGTVPTFGAESTFNAAPIYTSYVAELSLDKIGVIYRDGGDGQKPNMRVVEITGVIIGTWGDEFTFSESTSYYHAISRLEDNKFILVFTKDTVPYGSYVIKCEIFGTIITPLGSEQCFSNARSYYIDVLGFGADKYAFAWYDAGSDAMGKTLVVDGDLNTIPFCIGVMSEDGLLGETKKVDMIGSITYTLPILTPGWMYYIQCDGSISGIITDFLIGIALEDNKGFLTKTII